MCETKVYGVYPFLVPLRYAFFVLACISFASIHATPRRVPMTLFFSLGRTGQPLLRLTGPQLSVGLFSLSTRPRLALLPGRLAALAAQKRAQHNALLAKKLAALHAHRPLIRAPRNPAISGGAIVSEPSTVQESINQIIYPADLFISNSITSPEFIGTLEGAASDNVLKSGDTMTGDLVMGHQSGIQLQGSDDGNTVRLQAPASVASGYNLTFPDYQGPAHAVMINQGGGTLAWHDVSPTSRYIQDGGNAVGEEVTIGTQDNYPLGFITNSVERMSIGTDGSVSTNGRFIINSGGAYVSGDVEIDGDLNFDGNMDVEGTLTTGGRLTVTSGGALISGDVEINGDIDFNGDIAVEQTLTSGGKLTVLAGGSEITGGLQLKQAGAIELYDLQPAQDQKVSVRAPNDLVSSFSLILPDSMGVSGYVLGIKSSVTGELEWIDIGADSPLVQSGGNTLGEGITMGTLDANSVSLIAGGNPQLVVDPSGNTRINGTLTVAEKMIIESQGAEIIGPLALQNQAQIRLYEAAPGTDYVALQSPLSIPAIYTLTLPTTAGSFGQVLSTDGAGNLSWASSPAPAGAVMLGGNTVAATMDVGTNNGYALRLETSGSPRISIASGGGITMHQLISAEDNIRLEDQHQVIFEDSGSNTVALYAPATISSSYALALPTADGTSGQVLTTNGAGQLSWSSGGTPANAVLLGGNTVSATMDVGTNNGYALRLETSGTPRISIASGGGITMHQPISAEDNIHLEDQHQVIFEDSGSNTVALYAPATISSSYALALPTADGTSGQVLATDGAGNLSWASSPAPVNAVLLGGNTVASTMQVGTLNAHDLALFTSGSSRLVIGSEGVYAATVDPDFGLAVIMDNTGKIGTSVSSRRFKCGIQEIGEDHDRFMQLRPVRYHLRRDIAHQTLYGFVAEELFDVYPELVVLDKEGTPLGIKEYLFSGILVNELQRLAREVAEMRQELALLRQ